MLAIVTVLALWWLLAQLRRTHPSDPSEGALVLDGVALREGALSDAMAPDAPGVCRGVRRARARMDGSSHQPEAHIDITLTPEAEPGPFFQALRDGPLQHAGHTVGRTLCTKTRLRATPYDITPSRKLLLPCCPAALRRCLR
ncbi:hypothetical protein ACFVJM_28065 [Streptomyces virginiae]|uniref:hypothetical protein n=1 Tax=Streptomyces virginiae TaxID=1961 RepID=UPI00363439F6